MRQTARYYIAMSTIDVIPIIGLGIGLYLIFVIAPGV
jgi:F0F1-type ATP synthase membrane subunit c/vacuolar-type H+-ATPase subunit K